jgi:hypothetical protein
MNQESVNIEGHPSQKKKMNGCLVAIIIFVIVSVLVVGGCFLTGGAALVGSAKKQAAEESAKLKSLLNASPSSLQPTGELADLFNPGSDHTNIQRENKEKEIKGQVVDWTLSVYEVRKSGENYRIQTKSSFGGNGNELAAFVELTPQSQEEVAFIEGLKTNDRFRFKGYIDGLTLTRDLEIKPAILVNPNLSSISKVGENVTQKEVVHSPASLQSLPDTEPSQLQPTGELAEIFNLGSDHTDIQRENKEKEIKGQVVDWTLSVYEVSKSGERYRIQTESSIGGFVNEVAAFVELSTRSQEEVTFIEGLKTNDRFRFKGCIAGIGMMRTLEIKPAILLSAGTASSSAGMTASERKITQSMEQANRQLEQEVAQALAVGKAIRDANDSSSERSAPNSRIPSDTLNDLPVEEERNELKGNFVIDQAREELELEKIKLEHEKMELEREKLRMQSQSFSEPKVPQPTNSEGEIFVTSITRNDIHNSKGVRLTDPVLILMQDRANVHRFGNPDGDPVDQFFSLADNRSKIRAYLSRGSFPQEVSAAVVNGNGQKFRVRIYKDENDKSCVDVSFANQLNPEGAKGASYTGSGKNLDWVVVYELIDSESNIREGPGTHFSIIRKSSKGEQGQMVEEKSPWIQLRFVDRSHGWVHKQNIRLSAKP